MSEFDLEAIRARDAACAMPKAPIEAVQWAQSNADRRALLVAYYALRQRLAEAERDSQRLDWLERHLFEGKWDGTIGRPKSWYMAGPYRHTLQRMRGDALREAIDIAMQADSAPAVHDCGKPLKLGQYGECVWCGYMPDKNYPSDQPSSSASGEGEK